MGHKQYRHTGFSLHLLDQLQYLRSSLWIQSGSGLVQNQDLGFHGKHTGDRNSPLLSSGEFKGRLLIELLGKAHTLKCFFCPGFDLLLGQSQILRTETHVGKNIDLKQLMLGVLKDQSHLAAQHFFVKTLLIHILTVKADRTGSTFDQTVQVLYQCRLAGTGMSDNSDKLSVGYLQTDIIQSGDTVRRILVID